MTHRDRPRDRNGGFPRLSGGPWLSDGAHGYRCPASLRHARARRKPWEAVSMGHYQRSLVLKLWNSAIPFVTPRPASAAAQPGSPARIGRASWTLSRFRLFFPA